MWKTAFSFFDPTKLKLFFGATFFIIITNRLSLNHSPSEWFSGLQKRRTGKILSSVQIKPYLPERST